MRRSLLAALFAVAGWSGVNGPAQAEEPAHGAAPHTAPSHDAPEPKAKKKLATGQKGKKLKKTAVEAPMGAATRHDAPAETDHGEAAPPPRPRAAPAPAKADADGTFTIRLDDPDAADDPTAPAHAEAPAAHGAEKAAAHGAKGAARDTTKGPAEGPKKLAHDKPAPATKAGAGHERHDQKASKGAAHVPEPEPEPESEVGDEERTEDTVDPGKKTTVVLEPPKRRPKPRDWKPLQGTGSAEARKNKWGVVEAVPPAVAARTRMAFRGDEIEFPELVHFKHDSLKFEEGAVAVLGRIADNLQSSPEIQKLWIEGHTDLTGTERYNQKLSEARASAVREALVKLGVAPERLVAYGFGETRPRVPEKPRAKSLENRRVVFRLVQGDRPALQTRREVEFGLAAVVGVWGNPRWRLAPEGTSPAHGARSLPAEVWASHTEMPAEGAPATDAARGSEAPVASETPAEGAPATDAARGSEAPAVAAEAPAAEAEAPASGGEGWRPLAFRTQLPEGAYLDTGDSGRVLLRLPDLSRVLLLPGSQLGITKLFHSRTQRKSYIAARLERGTARIQANPDERGVSSSIWSFPGGAWEVGSADFELQVGDATGRVSVDRGAGKASLGGDASVRVPTGYALALTPDATPQAMLEPPAVESPLTGSVPAAVLVWKPAPGARTYRVEVAEDVTFYQPVHAEPVEATTATVPGLAANRAWYWRVRALDADGRAGRASRIYAFRIGEAAAPVPSRPPVGHEAD